MAFSPDLGWDRVLRLKEGVLLVLEQRHSKCWETVKGAHALVPLAPPAFTWVRVPKSRQVSWKGLTFNFAKKGIK